MTPRLDQSIEVAASDLGLASAFPELKVVFKPIGGFVYEMQISLGRVPGINPSDATKDEMQWLVLPVFSCSAKYVGQLLNKSGFYSTENKDVRTWNGKTFNRLVAFVEYGALSSSIPHEAFSSTNPYNRGARVDSQPCTTLPPKH